MILPFRKSTLHSSFAVLRSKKPDKEQTFQSAPYPAVVSPNNAPSERTWGIIAYKSHRVKAEKRRPGADFPAMPIFRKNFQKFCSISNAACISFTKPGKNGPVHCGTPRNMPQAGKKVPQSLPLCERMRLGAVFFFVFCSKTFGLAPNFDCGAYSPTAVSFSMLSRFNSMEECT